MAVTASKSEKLEQKKLIDFRISGSFSIVWHVSSAMCDKRERELIRGEVNGLK